MIFERLAACSSVLGKSQVGAADQLPLQHNVAFAHSAGVVTRDRNYPAITRLTLSILSHVKNESERGL